MTSTTLTNTLKRVAKIFLPLLFWLSVWQLASSIVNREFLFPGIPSTLRALITLLGDAIFWRSAFLTLLRVFIGLALGTVFGIVLAVLSNAHSAIKALISPLIAIMRSTPVATFIVILWVLMSANSLSVLIALIMVMPIVWQNVLDGFSAIDKDLLELSRVFEFTYSKRLRLIVIPTLTRYLIPAVITATGLAWKSEIAAEIIAYTANSIGQLINDAKFNIETPTVFALTVVIIVFSILLERLVKFLLGRVKV